MTTATGAHKDLHARLDPDLHAQLQQLVDVDRNDGRRSLNTFLNLALRRGLHDMTRRRKTENTSES